MRISATIAGLLVCFTLHGQTIAILGPHNETIPSAHITIEDINTAKPVAHLITDALGNALLPATLSVYPYLLRVSAFSYMPLTDTLFSATKHIWHLEEKLLNEVVVTGQYAPASADNAVQKIQVIDRKKIDAMGAQNLRDVLTNQLNVRLSQDAILGSNMSLQGVSGQGVKILVDGVPAIGRKDGNLDLTQFNLSNIERIEIIEGPMAVSYGTDALAGTINLISKKNQSKPITAGLTTYYETMGTYNINANLNLHKKRHSLSVNGGRNFFSGWNPGDKPSFFDFSSHPADYTRYQQWKPREQYMAGLRYTYTLGKTNISYTGNYFQELIINRGLPVAPYGENTFDGYYRTRRIDNSVFVKTELKEHKFINAFVSYNSYYNTVNSYYIDLTNLNKTISDANGGQDTSKFSQISSRATYSTSDAAHKINYELGYDLNLQYAGSTLMKKGISEMGDYAIFASAEYKPVADVTIRPGLRYAYNTQYQAPLIPSINTMYNINDHFKLRASYARGFRAPSLKELYLSFFDINHNIYGNPNLKAEYANNYSALLTYTAKAGKIAIKLDGNFFFNDIRNLISLAQSGAGVTYTYFNIGKNKTNGVQINGTFTYNRLNISLGGSYTGIYNDLSESYLGTPTYTYSPEARASVYYDIIKNDLRASLFYKFTGKQTGYTIDSNNKALQTYIESYSIADISVSKFFFKKYLNLTIGCKNLFNVQNVLARGAATAHESGATNVLIGTGRYYFIKLDLNLNDNR